MLLGESPHLIRSPLKDRNAVNDQKSPAKAVTSPLKTPARSAKVKPFLHV